MSVISACTRLSMRRPIPTIICASRRASTCRFMNAPAPTFTSSTSASMPAASFFDMMDDAISGMDSTVAVESRSAYSLPSAGATCGVCPMNASLCWSSCSRNSSMVRLVRNPGIDSSLSSVPPVWPSARPEIIGHHDSRRGRQRSRDQAGFVADAAGRMLIHLHAGNRGQIHVFAGLDHALGQGADFAVRHAGEKYGHQERGHLIIRDGSAGITVNEESNFLSGQLFAVPLAMDQVDSSHLRTEGTILFD